MMHAASILQEIRGPLEEDAPGILKDAYAVAIFPEFVKVGLFGGVKHGRGVLATRLASGTWSKPAFVRITSGSIGLQFGVSMSQLLVVFKDPKAVEAISGGQFSIGADAGYAAGELGGSAGAGTDNKLDNKIVAMARSKGLFAGVALEGGVLRIEKDSNVEFYNDAIGLDGARSPAGHGSRTAHRCAAFHHCAGRIRTVAVPRGLPGELGQRQMGPTAA